MTLHNNLELKYAREKLQELEERYLALSGGAEPDARLRDLSMRSLKRLINQIKEEIARYNTRHAASR